jgi:hypothetical protein
VRALRLTVDNGQATHWLARLAGETPCVHRTIPSSGE